MKIETHKEAFAEYLAHIEQAKHSIESSKRLLLILSSQAATEAISILLHKLEILDESAIVKHNQLDSKNFWLELPDFERKPRISELAAELERSRALAYGTLKRINPDDLLRNISMLFELKELVEEVSHEKL
jgi:hypothetical protein